MAQTPTRTRKTETDAAAVWKAYSKNKNKLLQREQEIIERYYAFNGNFRHTLSEIGKLYGITRERVRQIKFIALKKIEL